MTMSREKFDANCPGCRPVLLDVRTGKTFPDDSPAMKAINRVWHNMTLPEKEAWHEFTCQNSRQRRLI